jgi:hypothetical protein
MEKGKIGKHGKYGGDYITPCGVFSNLWDAAREMGTYDNKVLRACIGGRDGYGFKASVGREPEWYKEIVCDSNKSLKGSVLLSGRDSRGKKWRTYWLTPGGLFGDLDTACKWNEGFSEIEIKRRCILGKKGWGVFVK